MSRAARTRRFQAVSLGVLLGWSTLSCRRALEEFRCNCSPTQYEAVCVEDGDYAATPTGDTGAPPTYTGLTIAGDRVVLHRADGTAVTLDVVAAGPEHDTPGDRAYTEAYEAGCE